MVTDVFLLESHMVKRRQCQWMLFLSWNYSLPPSRKHTHTLTVALGAATDFHVPLWWAQRDLGQPPYHDCPLYTLAEAFALQVWKWVCSVHLWFLSFLISLEILRVHCGRFQISFSVKDGNESRDVHHASGSANILVQIPPPTPQHVTNSLQLPHSQNLSNLSATPQCH